MNRREARRRRCAPWGFSVGDKLYAAASIKQYGFASLCVVTTWEDYTERRGERPSERLVKECIPCLSPDILSGVMALHNTLIDRDRHAD